VQAVFGATAFVRLVSSSKSRERRKESRPALHTRLGVDTVVPKSYVRLRHAFLSQVMGRRRNGATASGALARLVHDADAVEGTK